MKIVSKIDKIRKEKGWSVNKLATEAMLTQSTVANMFSSGSDPKIATLNSICEAFGMTMSEFFYEGSDNGINPRDLTMLMEYNKLGEEEKKVIADLIRLMAKNESAV
ncbi:MAG: helix-turn-helix domain-containing protein [Christensenellales bacterium]